MDLNTARFLDAKIKQNPEFAKALSDEELSEIKRLLASEETPSTKELLITKKFDEFVRKREKYSFFNASVFNKMYWYENGIQQPNCILNKYTKELCVVNISREEFSEKIETWKGDDQGTIPDPFANYIWMSEKDFIRQTTGDLVGSIVDLKPKDRFFIVRYPAYKTTGFLGDPMDEPASLGTIDIARGVGEYGIMTDSPYNRCGYFNEHYFESISQDTDEDSIFRKMKSFFPFAKSKTEKFSILYCDFDVSGAMNVTMESPVMTYEEHFERLFHFNPLKK